MENKPFKAITIFAPGVIAGAEKVVITGLTSLYQLGLNPLIIIIKETRAPHFADNFKSALPLYIESVIVESTSALDFKLPAKIFSNIRDQTLPVVLHTHGFKALVATYLIKKSALHTHTHHGDTSHTLKVRLYEMLAFYVMKKCDLIFAVSEQIKTDLDRKFSKKTPVLFINNMLSFSNVSKVRKDRELKSNDPKKVVELIFVGRLSPEKGLLNFLECFRDHPLKNNFHLSIIGDGPEKKIIDEYIVTNKMGNLVTSYGYVADPSSHFKTPDVLIMPSLREGLPMTLIEALASGIPVIANKVGGIPNLINQDINGYLSEDHSIESWTEVLNRTIENYKRWRENAKLESEAIEIKFSALSWGEKTMDAYKSLL
jgi:glycosyltransferase involved in cell wall biosynthesis